MKKLLMVLLVMGVLAVAPAAKADCVSDGGTVVVLGTDNIPNANLSVSFCKIGNVFTLISINTNLAGSAKIFSIHWQNVSATLDTSQGGGDGVGNNTTTWTTQLCPPGNNCKADGFNPNSAWGGQSVGSGGDTSATLTFYFTGDPGYLGIHVGVGQCSGWTTNGPFTGNAGDPVPSSCLTQVPEPSALILLSAGILGILGIRRRMS